MDAQWDEVKVGAKKIIRTISREASRVGDIAALNISLERAKHRLDGEYKTLGKLSYGKLRLGADNAQMIGEVLLRIDALRRKISKLKEEIELARQRTDEDEDEDEELEVEPDDTVDCQTEDIIDET